MKTEGKPIKTFSDLHEKLESYGSKTVESVYELYGLPPEEIGIVEGKK